MTVIDADGNDAGTVEEVVLGQGDVSGVEQVASGPGAFLGIFARGTPDRDPDVPDEQAERLRTAGYLKVDGSGLLGGHFYAPADSIDSVAGDQVKLTFRRDDIEK